MINQIKPLLITPVPMSTESLMGFILRTSEVNGYTSPSQILRYAGLTENEIRSVSPPLDKIAQIYARKPEDFTAFCNEQQATKKRIKKWAILNHVIPGLYVNVKSTCICPECIMESGIIDSFGEIKYALVCAKHQRKLIDICSACNKKLKWQRKGLLICSCGHDLSESRGTVIKDESILNMTELIRWKLSNHHYDETNLMVAGYPLSDLRKISLPTLLGIIERLKNVRQRKVDFGQLPDQDSKLNTLRLASNMLANWPNGFYDFLENISPENRHVASRNLQSQYQKIYMSFFRTSLPAEEMKFLRGAFVNFANERLAEDVYIDVRLSNQAETNRRYVGIYGLAAHLKVQMPTVRNYVKKGLIIPQERESFGVIRMVFDLHNLPFKAKEGNYFKQREAAAFLGLNVRILRSLKNNGIYKIKRLGWGTDGYSELDLIEFKECFVNKAAEIIECLPEHHLCLKQLFKKRSVEGIVIKILDQVKKGDLTPLGRTGNEISDLVFTKQMVADCRLT